MTLAALGGPRFLLLLFSDVTQGMLFWGITLWIPLVPSGPAKLALITVALGSYAGSYTPNIWSILQASVAPEAVGAAAGIVNGLGAGGGGTLAGFLVGLLSRASGSYISGFVVLGVLVILCGAALLIYARPQPARSG